MLAGLPKVQGKPCIGLRHLCSWIDEDRLLPRKVTVLGTHQHASPAARLIGAALTAAALLLAAPVATALAAPPGDGPGAPGGSTDPVKPSSSGVNNRPGLDRPAPVVQAVQKAGDQVFTSDNAAWNDSPLGVMYRKQFGAAGVPQDADGVIEPGEAYQGKAVGLLNNPNIPGPGNLYDSLTGAGSAQPAASKGSNHGCAANVQVCIRN